MEDGNNNHNHYNSHDIPKNEEIIIIILRYIKSFKKGNHGLLK